jgi:hypothetical protein
MPIPSELLRQLMAVQIDTGSPNGLFSPSTPAPIALPPAIAPTAWGIAPGLVSEEQASEEGLADLDKRLKQAGIQSVPADFTFAGRVVEGRLLLGATRERVIRLGYKLGEWALFRISKSGVNVVYTGFNSRAR